MPGAATPDTTFITTDEGQLIECELRSGTGSFEPANMSQEAQDKGAAIIGRLSISPDAME